MHELLPLSWMRVDAIRPVYRDITLPFSRTRWITCADIPHGYSVQILYEDLSCSYPDGYVFRGCPSAIGAYFSSANCSLLRTGAEAVLDLHKPHIEGKAVAGSLARGKKHGFVEEISLHEANMRLFGQFRSETKHAGKPQLQHLFRDDPAAACRSFVFRSFSGQWLAAMTLSERGPAALHTELMLRHRHAPGDSMECLVAGIFEVLEREGLHEWSLGEVPFLMPMHPSQEPLTPMERFMVSLASCCKHAYDYEGLYRFKNKFAPEWRTVTLCTNCTPSPVMLAELALAMGFTDLLVHQSLDRLRQWIFPS